MYYKYQYPTISFILTNADRSERFREQTRHCPTFFPAPRILWVPEIPGRKSTVVVDIPPPPQLEYPPDWIQTYKRMLLRAQRAQAKAAASAPLPSSGLESLPEENADDGSDDDSVVSVTPATGNLVKELE